MKGRKIGCQTINCFQDDIYILTRKEFDLLVYNREKKELNYVAHIDDSAYYTTSCVVEDKIIFLPAYTNMICEYNISSNSIRYIPIVINNLNKPFKECWVCGVHEGYIYVACGSNSVPLVKIDPRSYKAESVSEWNSIFERKYGKQAIVCSRPGFCIVGSELWVALNEPNVLLQYNLAENTYHFHEVKTDRTLFYTINYYKENFWLTGEDKAIFKWSPVDGIISVLSSFPRDFENDNGKSDWSGLFYAGVQNDHEIIYIPLNGNMIIKCDMASGELIKIGEKYDDKYCFHAFRLLDGKIYAEFDTRETYNMSDSVIIKFPDCCTGFELSQEDIDTTDSKFARNAPYKAMIYKERYKGMLSAYINALFE